MTAVLGHMYPVWLRFRGGKGVATGAGAFLPLAPLPTAAALVAFVLVLAATRYVSIASIAGTMTLAVLAFLLGHPASVARAAAAAGLLILWKHRGNLQRLARGTESRVGDEGRGCGVRLAVLGGGSWGTALAAHLARSGHDVRLWLREPSLAREINERRENAALPAGRHAPRGDGGHHRPRRRDLREPRASSW